MQYRSFGVMLDCSRNAVMKPEELKKLIALLAKFGYNCVELYTEDTYEVENEPYLGYLRGRYTGAELKEIDGYARALGVELIPCIQTLGHFTAFRKNFPLRTMFDAGDILLCEEERTYELIERCFAALAENFTSRRVNIGMDEAHMLGLGNYLKKHGYTDRFEIFTRHLSKVAQIARKYGFTAHMWSDMFFRIANGGKYYGKDFHIPQTVVEKIPENVEIAYWDYTSVDQELYENMLSAHLETGRKTWYVGGAWNWCGFAPLNRHSLERLKPAMQAVRVKKIENVLITVWGDNGKESSFYAVLPTLYAARQYADGNFDAEKIKRGFEEIVGVSYDDFMTLDLPNEALPYRENVTGYPENPSKWLLYQDCFQGLYDLDYKARGNVPYRQYATRLRAAESRAGEYAYIFSGMVKLCETLEIKSDLGSRTRKAYLDQDRAALTALVNDYDELLRRLSAFFDAVQKLWYKENKPFGWEVQDLRLGGLERRVKTCKSMLETYLDGRLERLEELEEQLLSVQQDDLHERSHTTIVSRGIV